MRGLLFSSIPLNLIGVQEMSWSWMRKNQKVIEVVGINVNIPILREMTCNAYVMNINTHIPIKLIVDQMNKMESLYGWITNIGMNVCNEIICITQEICKTK